MESQVNLCVSCNGESQNFLVSDSENTTWADVETMVLVSYDLNDIQIKYMDEDNEEVSVNSQGEYEEALKSAVKQGGLLRMNVYEKQQPSKSEEPANFAELKPLEPKNSSAVTIGKRPLGNYSLLARTMGQDIQMAQASSNATSAVNQGGLLQMNVYGKQQLSKSEEPAGREELNKPLESKISAAVTNGKSPLEHYSILARTLGQEMQRARTSSSAELAPTETKESTVIPPDWFASYMEKFKEQIILETVERVTQSLRENSISDSSSYSSIDKDPGRPALLEDLYDWHLLCINCKQQIIGIRYQCSTCVSFSICEHCEAEGCDHDPSHLYLKMRRPVEARKESLLSYLATPKEQSRIPMQPCPQIIPTVSAIFVDENLPDGTHLQPGTKFIKHWRMKNTGNVKWSLDTKLRFMWGNLTLASTSCKETPVPSLLPNEVGVLSVEFIAPALEGTYTSHWRLSHKGEHFGPRIWCSIIVDTIACNDILEHTVKGLSTRGINQQEDVCTGSTNQNGDSLIQDLARAPTPETKRNTNSDRILYIPSVDLLTAQDLLSFELLDINIVQELERVPHNTPVDMTPCMSPLTHDGPLIENAGLGQTVEESEMASQKTHNECAFIPGLSKSPENRENPVAQDEDISGTQFVCETVIRSLTLDAAPDYNLPQRKTSPCSSLQSMPHSSCDYSVKHEKTLVQNSSALSYSDPVEHKNVDAGNQQETLPTEPCPVDLYEQNMKEDTNDETGSQGSCDSTEDYIIILPECFDTSRPLEESMYNSALSETGCDTEIKTGAKEDEDNGHQSPLHSINDIFTISQTLDTVPLTPEVMRPSPQTRALQEAPGAALSLTTEAEPTTIRQSFPEQKNQDSSDENAPALETTAFTPAPNEQTEHPRAVSIAGGLVKGALSVAASAYKALFSGQQETNLPRNSEEQERAMMAILFEMGFCDRQLNQRLLRKHDGNLMDVVTELIQINDNDWYSARY
ncbi:neighbor of BRCA1 gene 1 L homeolog isoform X2 [Xenopus laevis]|uniref:Next to BRCA1 gene 1 protein n=1 Tax=Xenopus laevis TaxID=8355 RepID=A0A8J0TTL9_XENLA|nr:neighbor of BRCA1 gene 1 L homeolog isoform X2 [Xenopus laevis]